MAITTPNYTSFKKTKSKARGPLCGYALRQSILGSILDHMFLKNSVVCVVLFQ